MMSRQDLELMVWPDEYMAGSLDGEPENAIELV